MNKEKIAYLIPGIILLFTGYYFSLPTVGSSPFRLAVVQALSSLNLSTLFPLQDIVPAVFFLTGLGIFLRPFIKSTWILLAVLVLLGFLLTKYASLLPIGYTMAQETRYFFMFTLALLLWITLQIVDRAYKAVASE